MMIGSIYRTGRWICCGFLVWAFLFVIYLIMSDKRLDVVSTIHFIGLIIFSLVWLIFENEE